MVEWRYQGRCSLIWMTCLPAVQAILIDRMRRELQNPIDGEDLGLESR